MLRNLTIDNYALIDRLDIDFDDGHYRRDGCG